MVLERTKSDYGVFFLVGRIAVSFELCQRLFLYYDKWQILFVTWYYHQRQYNLANGKNKRPKDRENYTATFEEQHVNIVVMWFSRTSELFFRVVILDLITKLKQICFPTAPVTILQKLTAQKLTKGL